MKASPRKRRSAAAGQPDLFGRAEPDCIARLWPEYAGGGLTEALGSAPFVAWANSVEGLSDGAQGLLVMLAGLGDRNGRGATTIADLALQTDASQNATRTRMDRLLSAGVIVIRPKAGRRPSGYEFKLVADDGCRADAMQAGYAAKRSTLAPKREKTNG